MTSSCIPSEEIGRVAGLPLDSPERVHAANCPRCRASLATYLEFMGDGTVPAGAMPGAAEAMLRAAFREAAAAGAGVPAPPSPAPVPAPQATPARSRAADSGFLATLRAILRPAVLVPAVVGIVAIGIYAGYDRYRMTHAPDALRGAESTGKAGAAAIEVESAHAVESGIEMRWRAVPGATSYGVTILGDGLGDLARVATQGETVRLVRWEEMKSRPRPGATIGWQVSAFRDGAAIARSRIGAIEIP